MDTENIEEILDSVEQDDPELAAEMRAEILEFIQFRIRNLVA